MAEKEAIVTTGGRNSRLAVMYQEQGSNEWEAQDHWSTHHEHIKTFALFKNLFLTLYLEIFLP